MRPGFAARAMAPYCALIACATRAAVVKSALFSESAIVPFAPMSSPSTLFSTMAPPGVVPTVGKFFCCEPPLPEPDEKPPVATGP